VLGKIVSLMVKHNVGVVMCDDNKQMAYVIKNIVNKIIERREE
jgi:hypothetical protein